MTCQQDLEYIDCLPCREVRHTPKNRLPGHNTKLHLVVRLQFWSSEQREVPIYCHHSQVHSDPKL